MVYEQRTKRWVFFGGSEGLSHDGNGRISGEFGSSSHAASPVVTANLFCWTP